MTAYNHLHQFGSAYHLAQHFAQRGVDPETTLVTADHRIVADFASFRDRSRYPDLLIAFDVDPAAHRTSNGYAIDEQGKPPDFEHEIASASTGGSMSATSATTTWPSASPSTGASTRPGSTTARGWPATA